MSHSKAIPYSIRYRSDLMSRLHSMSLSIIILLETSSLARVEMIHMSHLPCVLLNKEAALAFKSPIILQLVLHTLDLLFQAMTAMITLIKPSKITWLIRSMEMVVAMVLSFSLIQIRVMEVALKQASSQLTSATTKVLLVTHLAIKLSSPK